ncbi:MULTISPECIES: type IV secretion system protein VirB10 [unclassified Mesorhizobium]|uniref:type IV secretion system protein VirB10 n=1 Tax=unclassified Mesorhizobium TaxID=325217 RepID=UPI00112A80B0|nr:MULTISPECIES: type IV secretion system protein VirB10 [unclassified Mesorhizobium]MBZ9739758.1 type IV secretion system protein VirB10 [Mesorhizobium sp. CO1-1-4]MBZ9804978.1 type IV secretion system protein VirB10 [Mesorhizobium sp. ES1-6]TPL88721.1 TrbI/VirB10 family protein [Mesorhizobium sp. B2-3-12]
MAETTETNIPGERGQTSGARKVNTNPLLKRGVVVLAVVSFMGFAIWSMRQTPKNEAEQPGSGVIRQTTEFEPARAEPEPVALPVPEIKLPTPALETAEAPAADKLLEAARRAPVMAFGGGRTGNSARQSSASETSADPNFLAVDGLLGGGGQGENEDQRFNRMLKPTILEGSKAGHLGNRNFIVAMGTSIPCALETALSSDQPGFTSCVITRDVLSDNGRVVLMEKGTQVVGEYRGGLRRGQGRLLVLWNRAKTPTGVIITLASPATDAIGRAGFDGYVDTHWWERFGSALLLSVVGDVATYAGQELQRSDVQAQGTTSAGKEAAAIAVEQSINIPPTLMKHQGSLVSIFVARDLDFSTIYRLRVTEPRNTIYDRAVMGDFYPKSDLVRK